MTIARGRRFNHHEAMQRVLHRLNIRKAVAEEARSQHSTLDDILSPKYTTELPSAASAKIADAQQRMDSADSINRSTQDTGSESPLKINDTSHRNNDHANFASGDRVGTSAQCDIEYLTSAQSHRAEDLPVNFFKDSEDDNNADSDSERDRFFGSPRISQVSQQVQQADERPEKFASGVLPQRIDQEHRSSAHTPGRAHLADWAARNVEAENTSASEASI